MFKGKYGNYNIGLSLYIKNVAKKLFRINSNDSHIINTVQLKIFIVRW